MDTAHLVPMVLLVGEHQKAPIVNEDTDEVLEKERSGAHPQPRPGKAGQAGFGGDRQSGKEVSALSPSLRAAQ